MSNPEATFRVPGAVLTEREHQVPLDHASPGGEQISVFTRELAAPDGLDRPYLLFLQGGPGGEATRPTAPPSGWQKRAIQDYRVLLIDQRGTGRSTPVGDIPGDTPEAQATYMTHLRADSIVRDAELIRKELGIDRWSLLGQSFGGFCSMTYLSFFPDGVREAFLTGGLSPIGRDADDVYAATWLRVQQRQQAYFDRYPGDRERVRGIVRRLDDGDVRLFSGERLTSGRFLQIGSKLGDSAGFEAIHNILEQPFGSRGFLHDAVDGAPRYGRNPIYATLHESSYADGVATRWSAERTMPAQAVEERWFTAEHMFRWMWDDYLELRSHKAAAEILAEHPWPKLYDAEQLARNEVPVAATIYETDLYVEKRFAAETAAQIKGLKPWVTNEYEHNGLRADGERVLGRLIDLVRGRA
ncbi:MAG TPA: alpha/beta fold hydrolase [Candidatus Limnocylindria bacterium]|nr:alpha/beta fold hydrolase [Candidatus Limnocylindria bacterium]